MAIKPDVPELSEAGSPKKDAPPASPAKPADTLATGTSGSEKREDAGKQAEAIIVEALNKLGIPAELGTAEDDHIRKVDLWIQLPGLIPIGIQLKFSANPDRDLKAIQAVESKGFREMKAGNPDSKTQLGQYSGEAYHFYSLRSQWELKQLFEQAAKMKLSPAEALLAKGGPPTLREMFADIIKQTGGFRDRARGQAIQYSIMTSLQKLLSK